VSADLRVGIVSWNTADLLDRCLAAVPAACGGLDVEVVVVDNDSGDASAEMAAGHDGVQVIRNPTNAGYGVAMNQALGGTDTDAEFLCALNPDSEPPPGSLAALVAYARRHPRAGLVVPRLANADGSLQHSVQRFPSVRLAAAAGLVPPRFQRGRFARRWWLDGRHPHDTSGPVDWAIGAVHVLRAVALGGEAPYSERWFMYVEDLEVCWRLHQRGWEVHLDAEVTVPHVGNAAGEQKWGGDRARRYWTASYDFHALAHGAGAARAWAATNVAGASVHYVSNRLWGDRNVAAQLRAVLPVHARAVVSPSGGDPARR
jgi:GT2 family glycosyltransferase